MNDSVEVRYIVLNIKGVEIHLTVAELRKLRDELEAVVGPVPAAPIYIPQYIPQYNPPGTSPSPFWSQGPNCCNNLEINANSDEWPGNWKLHNEPLHQGATLSIYVP